MMSSQPKPTRNLRKRKRTKYDINVPHETKRRRKLENFSERSASGFCHYCTNPYKLISCKQCHRSWHSNCLNEELLKNNDNTNNDNNHHHNHHQNEEQKYSDLMLQNININMPKLQLENTAHDDIETTVLKMKKAIETKTKKPNPNPKPIQLRSIPLKTSNISEMDYRNDICKWFTDITPSIMRQETYHHDTFRKQIVAIFDCSDCLQSTHICFICKSRTKCIENDDEELPQQCVGLHCGVYYHTSCLKEDDDYAKHSKFYSNGKIQCPMHHCWTCYHIDETKHNKSARKSCWYCPRSYHRNCAPPNAELISVQRTDTNKDLRNYPDFRFDLITCCWNDEDNDTEHRLHPIHPKPKDLQFGRDDVKSGIFKWNLWDGTVAEFYRLDDDPFSIDVKMMKDYDARKKRQSLNPFPKNFKKIQKSRYSKNYKKPPLNKSDYGQCSCVDGCASDWNCSNYGLKIECNDSNCGSRDCSECKNRQFTDTKSTDNVEIKLTKKTGHGAFAKRDLCQNQLIIEYVGEICTKQEANERIAHLNLQKSANFYFFQVDSKTVIDGTLYGNESRFLNHSCSANCYTGRWSVKGEDKLGIFASGDIKKGEELTYDYQYEVPNPDDVDNLAKCLCGSKKCRIFLGFNKKKAAEWREKYGYDEEEESRNKKRKKRKKKKKSKKKKKKRSKKKKKKRKYTENDSDKENDNQV